jgi:hypothetical protein
MLRRASLAVCLALAGFAAGGAPLKITAYINVTSGCQRPTEAFLAKLAKTYGDKVSLEVVNFGTPEGMKRWRGDGMKCMGIRLDGQDVSEIMFRGVKLKVAFMKPEGFFWTHEELAAAVRQKLDGVGEADRHSPAATTTANGETTTLVIGDAATYCGPDAKPIQAAAEVLNKLAKEKPLTQEDFALAPKDKTALSLSVRGQELLSVPVKVDPMDPRNRKAVQQAAKPLTDIINAYPCIQRPFKWRIPQAMHGGRN